MNPRRLEQIAGRWRWQLGARGALCALGVMGLVAAVTLPWTNAWLWVSLTAALATMAVALASSRPWVLDAAHIVRHLDRTYPDVGRKQRPVAASRRKA